MTSKFIKSDSARLYALDERREQLKQCLHQCRTGTLELFEGIDDATFRRQVHPDFSPVGWHLGHIAYTEALWLLERTARRQPLFPEYRRLFAADGLPKTQRVNLPTLAEVRRYLDTVRTQVFNYLETAEIEKQERLWRWLLQHESQHSETIAFVLQLALLQPGVAEFRNDSDRTAENQFPIPELATETGMIQIPAGEFEMGNDSIDALDNELPVHQIYLDKYWIDCYPVTCGEYRVFMQAGGYQNCQWWSDAGWKWLEENPVNQPLFLTNALDFEKHPVCGVSWYEADAYARFVGKRLPTEAEWEKAASWDAAARRRRTYPWGEATPDSHLCNHDNRVGHTTPVDAYPGGQSACGLQDALGNVWEWTSSVFDGYEGFVSYPYTGYSQVYFDGQHRVLRGGSWATRPWALRCAFRNWYYPGVRQILAGFRCARSAGE